MLAQISSELVIILILTLANGFFAASEIAIVSARRSRLEALAKQGNKGAEQALALTTTPNLFLATVQVGITLIGTFSAAFGGARIGDVLAENFRTIPAVAPYANSLALAIVVAGITYISLVLGELVPKQLALQNPERLATIAAPIMNFLAMVAKPLVALLTGSVTILIRLLRQQPTGNTIVTTDDILFIVREGTEAGAVQADEAQLIEQVFRASDRPVRAVMSPRTSFVSVDVTTPLEEIATLFIENGYSRVPVYEGTVENLLGVLHAKDFIRVMSQSETVTIRDVVRTPAFIVENAHLGDVLTDFRHKGTHLAFVIDEYGQISGLVTMEDLLEELVGEIRDEYDDTEDPPYVEREDGSWLVDASESYEKAKEQVGLPDVDNEEGFTTVAGMVLAKLNRVPQSGDIVEVGDFLIEVVDMDERRIDKVLIRPRPTPTETTPDTLSE